MKKIRSNQVRIDAPETIQQLVFELSIAFPGVTWEKTVSNAKESFEIEIETPHKHSPVTWNESHGRLYVVLLGDAMGSLKIEVTLKPLQVPDAIGLQFAKAYVRVFNEDVKTAAQIFQHQELWETLSISRATRAIARLTAFSTAPFLKWINTVEAATHLKYEGAAFQTIVLMSKQEEWISKPAGDGYIALKRPISFSEALLEEKWIRSISGSDAVGLHGLGHTGKIVGVVALSSSEQLRGGVVLPTELQSIAALIRPGTMAFVSAKNGDLYIILPSGAVFVKSQGLWHYQNFASFQLLLSKQVPSTLAQPLLQLLLDLSYSRKGALFVVPIDSPDISELVSDHTSFQRANRVLREAVSGLRIDSVASRKILLAAAAVDGATIISKEGVVLDVACMISEPSLISLANVGQLKLIRFPGARTTAAWNASISGLGIKVSEDGPILMYLRGELIGQLG